MSRRRFLLYPFLLTVLGCSGNTTQNPPQPPKIPVAPPRMAPPLKPKGD